MAWKTIYCGENISFSHCSDVGGPGDCAPTAIAMLVWNLGYGWGNATLARRTAAYAQINNSENPDKAAAAKRKNTCVVSTMVRSSEPHEAIQMLEAYGLSFDTAYVCAEQYSAQQSPALVSRGRSSTLQEIASMINTLQDGEGALVCGTTVRGIGHAVPVIRKKHVLVALDRIESEICWANVATGQTLARMVQGELKLSGNAPGKMSYKQAKKAGGQSLDEVSCVFKINKQNLLTTQAKVAGNLLATAHQYFKFA